MKCVICNGVLDDAHGHNAQPIKNGRCCSLCNESTVIPARIVRALESKQI